MRIQPNIPAGLNSLMRRRWRMMLDVPLRGLTRKAGGSYGCLAGGQPCGRMRPAAEMLPRWHELPGMLTPGIVSTVCVWSICVRKIRQGAKEMERIVCRQQVPGLFHGVMTTASSTP